MDRKFKFLRLVNGQIKSQSGDVTWKMGEWQKTTKTFSMCNVGFHCSPKIIQALRFVNGEVLAEVQVRGGHQAQTDKEVWSEMQLTKTWNWTKEDSVALAVYAAELVLPLFEAKFPNDHRPRKAINAARVYLNNAAEPARAAAWAAEAAA